MSKLTVVISALCLLGLVSCAKVDQEVLESLDQPYVIGKDPIVPPGVIKYCWEEPMVENQPVGPGLDSDGYYYNPAHLATREVRAGKWRPCKPVPDETKGEISGER